jgi:hypothetical protein
MEDINEVPDMLRGCKTRVLVAPKPTTEEAGEEKMKRNNRIYWTDGDRECSAPDPTSELAQEAMEALRSGNRTLTQAECYALAEMCEMYEMLLTHPAGTEAMVKKLRRMRRAVKGSK